jgi:hypothetical protein
LLTLILKVLPEFHHACAKIGAIHLQQIQSVYGSLQITTTHQQLQAYRVSLLQSLTNNDFKPIMSVSFGFHRNSKSAQNSNCKWKPKVQAAEVKLCCSK